MIFRLVLFYATAFLKINSSLTPLNICAPYKVNGSLVGNSYQTLSVFISECRNEMAGALDVA